jgi:2-amino-4-hydroxy-6-hydroxymethyldihydropteridine diphosphokinase
MRRFHGGYAEQPPYLNAVWQVETALSPWDLLAVCQAIEDELGRPRQNRMRWGPRVLDLDLLAYGEVVCAIALSSCCRIPGYRIGRLCWDRGKT